jgi:hypothetical protein
MSVFLPVLTSDQITEITNYVNNYRALNQAPPLVWDNTIQNYSDQWSYYLLTNNLFQHSGSLLYGENLAYFEGYGTDVMTLLKKAVDSWYNEISSYDFSNPGFSVETGHFTCLVWAASTNFAISISIDEDTTAADIVLNTSPPGNIDGEYETNVLPIATQPPIPVPNPPTPPIPISNSSQIINIINELNNIIYSINKKLSAHFIIILINKTINDLSILNIGPTNSIIYTLQGLSVLIKNRKYNRFVINTINNIISQLKLYL